MIKKVLGLMVLSFVLLSCSTSEEKECCKDKKECSSEKVCCKDGEDKCCKDKEKCSYDKTCCKKDACCSKDKKTGDKEGAKCEVKPDTLK